MIIRNILINIVVSGLILFGRLSQGRTALMLIVIMQLTSGEHSAKGLGEARKPKTSILSNNKNWVSLVYLGGPLG